MRTIKPAGGVVGARFAVVVGALTLCLGAGVEAQDGWSLHGHDLGGRRFSPLAAIDTVTVEHLVPLWTYHSGVTATFQATPIVVDSVMYRLAAVQRGRRARRREPERRRWRYTHESRAAKLCCGPANRGVAVADGTVYIGTVDGRLVALDASSGCSALGRHGRGVRWAPPRRRASCQADDPPLEGRARPGRPASASAPPRWSTTARSSSASPAWDMACTPTRDSRSSACRASMAVPG